MGSSANSGRERRKSPRNALKKILYVNLEPGNGGIVLNLSEGGLAFHSVVPLVQHGAVRLWFSLSNDHRLEVSGELVWANLTKKNGGVRFTNLTDEARAQIRNLAGELSILGGGASAHSTSLPASQEPFTGQEVLTSNPGLASREALSSRETATDMPVHSSLQAEDIPPPMQPPPGDYFPSAGTFHYPRMNSSWSAPPPQDAAPSLRGVLIALVAVVLIVVAGLLAYSRSDDVGAAMVRWGEWLEGGSRAAPPQVAQAAAEQPAVPAQAAPQGAAPALDPAVAPLAPPVAAENSTPENPTTENSPAVVTQAKGRTTPRRAAERTPESPNPPSRAPAPPALERRASAADDAQDSETDLALAQRYLQGGAQIRNSAAAAQFLWAAVAKGNSAAELTLADLYLNGDGVTKSCEQARVLLKAASDKGDAEATQTLSDLDRKRCR